MTTDAAGGVWTYTLELADALAPHGIEVHLATMGPPPDRAQLLALAESSVCSVHVSEFALEWQRDPWRDVEAAGQWLLELEASLEPTLVHLNGFAHGSLPWHAPAVVVAHSDVLSWWQSVHREPAPPEWDRYRAALQNGLESVAAVCAPTLATLEQLRRNVHFDAPGFVVYNGRRSSVARRAKEPFVLGVGRYWDEAKNLAALERVASRVPWPVVIAGDGAASGRRTPEEIASAMSRAAVFASPVRYEPFGLAILEAALAGCALVLGEIPSQCELWEGAALFVDPDDDAELTSALCLLAERPELLDRFARRARAGASRYSPEAMASGYLCVYGEALHPQRRMVGS